MTKAAVKSEPAPAPTIVKPPTNVIVPPPKDIADLLGDINKTYSIGATLASDVMLADIKGYLSTGSTALDIAMRGGIPLGRVVEFYGMESSGKSTVLTHTFINCQRKGQELVGKTGLCVLVDYEGTFSKRRAARMGLDLNYLIELPADSVEKGFEQALGVMEKTQSNPDWQDRPVIIAFDTIHAAPTDGEKEDKAENMAAKSKAIQKGFRKTIRDFGKHSVTFLVLNQMISDIGVTYGSGMSTSGGNALRFYASVRVFFKNTGKRFFSDELVGSTHKATVVKDKMDGLWLEKSNECEFQMFKKDGIDDDLSLMQSLLTSGKCPSISYDKQGRWRVDDFDPAGQICFWDRQSREKIEELKKKGFHEWLVKHAHDVFISERFDDAILT